MAVLTAVHAKIEMLNEKKARVPDTLPEVKEWINARFADDIVSLGEVTYDLEAVIPTFSQPGRARACLSAMDAAKVHPLAVEEALADLLKVLRSEPSKTQSAGRKVVDIWTRLQSKRQLGRG